ncbi:MAG: TIGR02996 domain-containing protein [Labilithrix sp.]
MAAARKEKVDAEAAFLDVISAAPDDDAPRLVYADHLLESADELSRVRGELIIAQCTRAREPMWSEAWLCARATEKRLLPLVRGRGDGGFKVEEWSRGFPSWIQITPAALRARAETIELPLETLSFTTSYEEPRIEVTLGELAWARRAYPHVRQLIITNAEGGLTLRTALLPELDESDARLAWPDRGVPHVSLHAAITRLVIIDTDEDRLEPYLGLPLPALDELLLRGADVERMVAMVAHRRLRDLGWRPELDAERPGLALARSNALDGVERSRAYNHFEPELAEAIAASSSITDLSVRYDWRTTALARLAAMPLASRVRRLELHYGHLNRPRDREPIMTGHFSALRSLSLRRFHLAAGARLELPALVELELEFCKVDDAFSSANADWMGAHRPSTEPTTG